jgi:type I restriction-modification system DNA methylase subunit
MKPLKADYGMLYNGLEIIFFERVGNDYERLFKTSAENVSEEDLNKIVGLLEKPNYDTTDINKVSSYFEQFDDENERLSLVEEAAREHFFQNFQLNENSEFGNLLINTIKLFEEQKGSSTFLDSAYDFWKQSYAKKPESVPAEWKPLMKEAGLSQGKKDLYKFMFCLETAYAVFARLILAKSGEDYGFPDVEFREFIETEVKRASKRNDINQSSYAKITQELIKNMQWRLVSSVFEEDIFYWWTEPYEDKSYDELFGHQSTLEMGKFGESLAKMLMMIYKYDFSKIEGDPLGVLYQKYFDKETRKALGEFYTPQEVVDYILDSVEYEGRQVLDKRLLDPACGSGTFTVTALQRYLNASEQKAEEEGWDNVLDDICNKYRLVGFDIHPFATIMAQIQFMLVLLPYYKKAVNDAREKDEHFTLQRVPIFRTDSLMDESEGEDSKMTLKDYEDGSIVSMDIKLPVTGAEEDSFFETEFEMPHTKTVRKQPQLDIHNNEEYFATLQALFDTVKQQADDMQKDGEKQEFNKTQFIRILKLHYLSDKNFDALADFFTPFANDLLEKIYRLQTEFDDGRLIKSIEDIFLAALLKNEQKYDYVVGNPPYVNIKSIPDDQKEYLRSNYESAKGQFDLYCPFYERGVNWLNEESKLGYIAPNQFMTTDYASDLRSFLLEETEVVEVCDFRDSEVFEDATNYPAIVTLKADPDEESKESNEVHCMRVKKNIDDSSKTKLDKKIVNSLRDHKDSEEYSDEFIDIYKYPQKELNEDFWALMPPEELEVFNKLEEVNDKTMGDVTDAIFHATSTSANKIYVVEVLNENRIEPDDKGSEVTVVPLGGSKEYKVETDLIRPFLDGKDVKRWNADWSGYHLIHPYEVTKEGNKVKSAGLVSKDRLKNDLPLTWEYFKDHKEDLEARERGRKEGKEDWYGYIYGKNLTKFENPKIVQAHISEKAKYMADPAGIWYFTTAYGVLLNEEYRDKTNQVLCQLNSSPIDFYFKHIANIKSGGYYEYIEQYVERVPLKVEDEDEEFDGLEDKLSSIIDRTDLKNKLNLFPAPYLSGAELSAKTLSCDSGHSSMDPSIQETQDGMYGVVIGKRKKEDPILVDSKEKARFVKKSIEGDSVKKGDEIEVLVPRSNAEVKRILEEFEDDKKKLEEMDSVEELEEEINELVYQLYDLDENDIDVIEDFLEKF